MLGLPGPPSPQDLAAAAANAYDMVLRGGVADLRRMPKRVLDEGPQRSLYRYLGEEDGTRAPVLLVPPLAAPALCFDLRRGCSVAEHLVTSGRRTYLVDYGAINFADRNLGLEHWIEDVIPQAVRGASEDAGGRPVKVVGWCLGGIMTTLAAAAEPELPIESIALVAPLRPIAAVTQGRGITELYRFLGGAPAPLVKRGYQLAGIDKYLMKPYTILSNLHRRELLAQIEAVDHFMNRMHAYPGRTFGQLYHRFFRTNDLADGRLVLRDRTVRLADVRVPVLAVAGRGDGIAPVRACHHVADVLPGAPSVRLETAPGGHLGVLTGRAARDSTWPLLDAFLDEAAAPMRRARRRKNPPAAA